MDILKSKRLLKQTVKYKDHSPEVLKIRFIIIYSMISHSMKLKL